MTETAGVPAGSLGDLVGAVRELRGEVRRVIVAVERLVPPEPARVRREPERLGRGSGTMLLLKAMPSFAALWTTVVPEVHVTRGEDRMRVEVSCPCGARHVLPVNEAVMADTPACRRWWLALPDEVRVHRLEEPAAAVAA